MPNRTRPQPFAYCPPPTRRVDRAADGRADAAAVVIVALGAGLILLGVSLAFAGPLL